MILKIDTSDNENMRLVLDGGDRSWDSIVSARKSQSEKLLPAIDDILKKAKKKIKDLKGVVVESEGGSFTSLRIGVATANALAFALGIPVSDSTGKGLSKNGLMVVEPKYSSDPDIGPHS